MIFCVALAIFGFLFNSYVLLITSLFICFQAFLNLLPFLRSDGYWILSDLIVKPNLLHHSFGKVKGTIRQIFGKGNANNWSKIDVFLFFYGTMNYGFLVAFVYYVLFQNPNSIIEFPTNLSAFLNDLFCEGGKNINLVRYGELIVPLMFYYLLFGLLKPIIIKVYKSIFSSVAVIP